MNDFTHSHRYVVLSCADCKVTFGVTEEHFKQLKATGEAFYCPSQVTGMARTLMAFT